MRTKRTMRGSSSTTRISFVGSGDSQWLLPFHFLGKREHKDRSSPRHALDPHPPSVGFDDGLYQVQPQPRALCAAAQARVDPVEPVKDPVLLFGRNADALVGHIDRDPGLIRPPAHPDRAAFGRVLDGVAHQV